MSVEALIMAGLLVLLAVKCAISHGKLSVLWGLVDSIEGRLSRLEDER
jgi:hypothetical protein